jgi:hypothetical protein
MMEIEEIEEIGSGHGRTSPVSHLDHGPPAALFASLHQGPMSKVRTAMSV